MAWSLLPGQQFQISCHSSKQNLETRGIKVKIQTCYVEGSMWKKRKLYTPAIITLFPAKVMNSLIDDFQICITSRAGSGKKEVPALNLVPFTYPPSSPFPFFLFPPLAFSLPYPPLSLRSFRPEVPSSNPARASGWASWAPPVGLDGARPRNTFWCIMSWKPCSP